ncbi:hypothetical protein HJFPF1_08777 [Paramyrothecium foliicola]|nr:hypothetical protein HJFPF1_08777 [Paramyrothecium foliicola]
MASRVGPRTVKDATRFTSTIPHATSKSAAGTARGPASSIAASVPPKQAPRIPGETPEQRVRRLRMAHLAAQQAQISKTDRFLDSSRRFLDVAHRWTVKGIVIFTVVAGVISIYSVWDMLRYNRARRAEWAEAQKRLEEDSLAAARLAYLKGEATESQIFLVEEANREAEEKGEKLPPLLAPPEHRTHFEEHFGGAGQQQAVAKEEAKGKGVLGVFSGFLGSKAAETSTATTTTQSVSSSSGVVQAAETQASNVQDKARGAWEAEKENQRRGGSLDQLGLETAGSSQSSGKKGWWPW